MVDAGGKIVFRVGVQNRPVIEYNGKLYEKAIQFDDGYDHSEMYAVPPERAIKIRGLILE